MPPSTTIIFLIKLGLTPLLIALATLAGRRWGGAVSGLIVGLPLTSGPVTLFLALGQGVSFAAVAATATLLGTISNVAYSLTYAWLAQRMRWPLALAGSCATFFIATFLFQFVRLPVLPVMALVLLVITLGRALMPVPPPAPPLSHAIAAPRWDLPARMILATGLVIVLTATASSLGPHLTGLLTPFPLYVSLLAAFAQHLAGADEAVRVLRGLLSGLYAFVVFFGILALGLNSLGISSSFILALVGTLALQLYMFHRTRREQTAATLSSETL